MTDLACFLIVTDAVEVEEEEAEAPSEKKEEDEGSQQIDILFEERVDGKRVFFAQKKLEVTRRLLTDESVKS